jgi:hypothetical protein
VPGSIDVNSGGSLLATCSKISDWSQSQSLHSSSTFADDTGTAARKLRVFVSHHVANFQLAQRVMIVIRECGGVEEKLVANISYCYAAIIIESDAYVSDRTCMIEKSLIHDTKQMPKLSFVTSSHPRARG